MFPDFPSLNLGLNIGPSLEKESKSVQKMIKFTFTDNMITVMILTF